VTTVTSQSFLLGRDRSREPLHPDRKGVFGGAGHLQHHALIILPFPSPPSVTNPFLPTVVLSTRQIHDLSGHNDSHRRATTDKGALQWLSGLPTSKCGSQQTEAAYWEYVANHTVTVQTPAGRSILVNQRSVCAHALATRRSHERFRRKQRLEATFAKYGREGVLCVFDLPQSPPMQGRGRAVGPLWPQLLLSRRQLRRHHSWRLQSGQGRSW
jgi:hypothetical protein